MTQEDKELLLKDIYARIPYGIKGCCEGETFSTTPLHWYAENTLEYSVNYMVIKNGWRPYLFPLSSMTKEQYKEWCDLEEEPLDEILTRNANGEKMSTLEHHLLIAKSLTDSVNYCYKNHFDIYGLISKGLALDATGKGIY